MANAGSPKGQTAARKSLGLSLQNIYETLAISVPTVADAMRSRVTKEKSDSRLARWARNVVANAKLDVEVTGRENLTRPPAGIGPTFLVMSNHQSLYDVPVLFDVLGSNLRMVAKKELFAVPIFGRALEHGGFISIDRGDRDSALQSLDVAKQMASQGTHIWIAPEGTRSRTGALLPFKKGGFNLAMEASLPILPLTLRGTRDCLTAKGLRSAPGAHVRVTIHPAIDPRPYEGKAGRDRLIAAVRAVIESAL
jgi:1-acyl-sn-glycerol-3-phosphate acyltransferase